MTPLDLTDRKQNQCGAGGGARILKLCNFIVSLVHLQLPEEVFGPAPVLLRDGGLFTVCHSLCGAVWYPRLFWRFISQLICKLYYLFVRRRSSSDFSGRTAFAPLSALLFSLVRHFGLYFTSYFREITLQFVIHIDAAGFPNLGLVRRHLVAWTTYRLFNHFYTFSDIFYSY